MQAGPVSHLLGVCANLENLPFGCEKRKELSFPGSCLPSSWLRKTQHNTCANLARQRHCWPQVSCLQPGIMAPIWFPQCEKSVLAIILSRSKGHDTQSSKIPSHSYWVGLPYCLNKLIKHQTPELTGPSFASCGRSVLSRGDQLVPSSVSTVFLTCGTRASAIYKLSRALVRGTEAGGGGKHKWVNRVRDSLCQLLCSPNNTLRDFCRLRVSQNHSFVVQMEVAVFLRKHLRWHGAQLKWYGWRLKAAI